MTDLRKLVEDIRDIRDLVCEIREYTFNGSYTGGWDFDMSVDEAAKLIELYLARGNGCDRDMAEEYAGKVRALAYRIDELERELEEAQHERGDWKDLYSDAVARCEQLKRERDEAQAERDEPWVRLDDETAEAWARSLHRAIHPGLDDQTIRDHRYTDVLANMLRYLRDGEL
jgi:hypothetical protein